MEIEDPGDALQFDYALAYKHDQEDRKEKWDQLEAIQNMLTPIGQALGVQYPKSKTQTTVTKALPDDLPVEEVLKRIGGKNIMVNTHGKQ